MSEKKNHLKEIMIWASETPENKKKAIQGFAFAIHTLSSSDKKLNERELEKLAGGFVNASWISGADVLDSDISEGVS